MAFIPTVEINGTRIGTFYIGGLDPNTQILTDAPRLTPAESRDLKPAFIKEINEEGWGALAEKMGRLSVDISHGAMAYQKNEAGLVVTHVGGTHVRQREEPLPSELPPHHLNSWTIVREGFQGGVGHAIRAEIRLQAYARGAKAVRSSVAETNSRSRDGLLALGAVCIGRDRDDLSGKRWIFMTVAPNELDTYYAEATESGLIAPSAQLYEALAAGIDTFLESRNRYEAKVVDPPEMQIGSYPPLSAESRI